MIRSSRRFAQWLADSETNPDHRALMTARRRLRRLWMRNFDPAVSFVHHGYRLELPLSHELPRYTRGHPTYDVYLGILVTAARDMGWTVKAIDVGANIGDTAAVMARAGASAVLCVEADPVYLDYLKINAHKLGKCRIDIAPFFIGDGDERVSTVRTGGTASLEVNDAGVSTISVDALLAGYPAYSDANLLKVDTDGWEVRILRSASRWLALRHPLLVIEYDPERLNANGFSADDVWAVLSESKYSHVAAFSNLGFAECLGDLASARQHLSLVSGAAPYWDLIISSEADASILTEAYEAVSTPTHSKSVHE